MFIDWLSVTQEFAHDLPVVCDVFRQTIDAHTGEVLSTSQPRFQHEASYSTGLNLSVQGRKVTIEGNPSRVGRTDNLFGHTTIEQCITVYNRVLDLYGLPHFTRCTTRSLRDGCSGAKLGDWITDGAVITMIHLTTNVGVGKGNQLDYLRAVSGVRCGRNPGYLYPNGRGCTWTTEANGKGARLQYRKAYDKAFEIAQKLIPAMRRQFGDESPELAYANQLLDYCQREGVIRFEQELKSEYLARENLRYWGLIDESRFQRIHGEFLALDSRLKVTAMDIASVSEQLLLEKVVETTRAANTTALYAIQWAHGQNFDFTKSQVKTHAARLNRIGIDIRTPHDITRNSLVFVREAREVTPVKNLIPPAWYQRANHLRAVA
ncbi:phage/plasmid replication domain-containing protein [Stutzerimonas chloritidismutans]|uniref:Phage/plasmid replication protein n=1 Tax=Stutzerimonas chloritidismutans TaxID=203192 RepID=A0ABU9MAH3_STUCH